MMETNKGLPNPEEAVTGSTQPDSHDPVNPSPPNCPSSPPAAIRHAKGKTAGMTLQELLLFGPVQAIDHGQILKMLSLYAAMKPTRTIERHMVFKAKRPNVQIPDAENRPEMQPIAAKLKASLYYIHLVRNITDDKFGSNVYGAPANTQNGTQSNGEKMDTDASDDGFPPETKKEMKEENAVEWSIVFSDTPIAGGKGIVTQRGHSTTKIWDDNPLHFMNLWGFEYVREYILEGHLVVHENVNVFLHRSLEFPPTPAPAPGQPTSPTPTPYQGLPEWNQLTLYDKEGNYLMQTQLMLENGQPELVELGTSELLRFKKDWRQFVNLEPGDRLDMDMRVK